MDLKTLSDTAPWDWPKDAKKTILEALRDRNHVAAERLLAVELAGDVSVIDDQLASQVLEIVKNPEESDALRAEAVIALGPVLEYSDEEGFDGDDLPISEATFDAIRASLQALFSDAEIPKEVRRCALEASARAPQPWHEGAVRDAYASGDAEWTLTAVFCMRYLEGFDAQILEALESEGAEIRHEAVCAAGSWGVEAAWPLIAPVLALKTPKSLLLAAIEAAVYVGPEDALPLLQRLLTSRDEDVVEAVHEALAMIEGFEEEEEGEEDPEGTWH